MLGRKLVLGVAAAASVAVVSAAGAHHSPSMFDFGQTITLSGTVKAFQWTNPHSYIQLLAEDDSGRTVEWSLEMGAPIYLYNRGWRRSTLKAGDRIRVTAVPLRQGGNGALVQEVASLDGRQLGKVQ